MLAYSSHSPTTLNDLLFLWIEQSALVLWMKLTLSPTVLNDSAGLQHVPASRNELSISIHKAFVWFLAVWLKSGEKWWKRKGGVVQLHFLAATGQIGIAPSTTCTWYIFNCWVKIPDTQGLHCPLYSVDSHCWNVMCISGLECHSFWSSDAQVLKRTTKHYGTVHCIRRNAACPILCFGGRFKIASMQHSFIRNAMHKNGQV